MLPIESIPLTIIQLSEDKKYQIYFFLPGARPIKVKSFIIIVLESTITNDEADKPFFPRRVWGRVCERGIFSLTSSFTITRLYNA